MTMLLGLYNVVVFSITRHQIEYDLIIWVGKGRGEVKFICQKSFITHPYETGEIFTLQ